QPSVQRDAGSRTREVSRSSSTPRVNSGAATQRTAEGSSSTSSQRTSQSRSSRGNNEQQSDYLNRLLIMLKIPFGLEGHFFIPLFIAKANSDKRIDLMRPSILAETNWKALKDETFDVAILPWGATEAHNYHLPYGTDVFEADAIAAEAGKIAWEAGAKVIVMPTIPFG